MKNIMVVAAILLAAYGILLASGINFPFKIDFGAGLDHTGKLGIGFLAILLAVLLVLIAPNKQSK